MRKSAVLVTVLLAVAAIFLISSTAAVGAPPEKVRVFIQFEPGKGAQVRESLVNAGGEIHYSFEELDTFAVTLPQQALNGIAKNPNVVLIEEDTPRYLDASPLVPFNLDTLDATGQTVPYGIDSVQAREIWDVNLDGAVDSGAPTGSGRLVCIIDSGLMTAHEDFVGVNVKGGYPAGWNSDACGHGTHVAGTIAAANNTLGVVGVTPGGASLYIVKVFGDDCSWTYSSTLVNAANQCEAAGANIISMSLGGSFKNRTEETTFQNLYNKGILSIAAAGNDGTTRLSYPASYASVVSVAAIDANNVVADFSQKNSAVELAAPGVGVLSTVPWLSDVSVSVDGAIYAANHIEFAAYGTATAALVDGGLCTSTGSWSGKVVLCQRGDISFYDKVLNVQKSGGAAAIIYNNVPGSFLGTLGEGYSSTIPAVSVSMEDGQFLTTKVGKATTVTSTVTKPGSGYEAWDGTSMATPHVSGVAALVWSANSSWTNAQLRDAFQKSALDLGTAGKDNSYGYGLVQAKSALDFLGGYTPPPPPPPPGTTLVASVKTDKASYVNNNTVVITTSVTDGTNPVAGAAVTVTITSANGKTLTYSGTTGSTGAYVLNWKVSSKTYGVGTYTVTSVATKDTVISNEASTTFTVTR